MTKAGGAGAHGPARPSEWVLRGLRWLPAGARVLDFASGTGRHARAADQRGLKVTASDRDSVALEQIGGEVHCIPGDLESGSWPFEPASFDAVIATNYLYRPRFSELCELLRPGGLLIYETFALGNERYGRPSNPDFLLQPGELFDRCRAAGLAVLAFEDGVILTGRQARVQRILAVRPPMNLEGFAIE